MGRALAEAGYDLVIGTGSHTAQPVEMALGTPVLYGLGNFVFGTPGRFDTFGEVGIGLVATVQLGRPRRGRRARCRCGASRPTMRWSRTCLARATRPPVLARQVLGQEVTWNGAAGTVTF